MAFAYFYNCSEWPQEVFIKKDSYLKLQYPKRVKAELLELTLE